MREFAFRRMDELAKFRFAPPDLPAREATLLGAADVVFTGGYQLFTRKQRHHRNVHLYGCGVDLAHYAKARDSETQIPADIASLPRPILGYFGVIDERLDYGLIESLASAFDSGSVVMIGPYAKVDPATLPMRSTSPSTRYWMSLRLAVPSSRKSSNRPGVATSTSTPFCSSER